MPLRKSVATNCSSDLPNLHSSSSSSSSLSYSNNASLPASSPSETDMLHSAAADEVRIFRNAKNRLESFRLYNWPREDIDTRDLAEAGFFLPKVRQLPDEVECIFCRVKVGNWSPGVDAFCEHLRHSPRCDFLSGYIVGNIPLGGTPATDPIRGRQKRIPPLDVCGYLPSSSQPSASASSSSSISPSTPCFPSPFSSTFANDVSSSSRPSDSVSIQPPSDPATSSLLSHQQLVHRPPKYCNLVTTQARLKTYPENWCPDLCPLPAATLAEAGFFYSGPLQSQLEPGQQPAILRDVVTCFHCGRKVFNWSPDDEPWEEHLRLNNNCYFLELNYKKSGTKVLPSTGATGQAGACHLLQGEPSSSAASEGGVRQVTSSSLQEESGGNNANADPLEDISGMKDEISSIASQESEKSCKSGRPSSIASDESKGTCKVCYMNEVELLFLPCKHASCCGQCAASVTSCPLCRAPITGSIRIFLA